MTSQKAFFVVEPETTGVPRRGERDRLHVVFDVWLGDDLVRAFPAVLVTARLRRALLDIRGATGFTLSRATAVTSEFYRAHSPEKRLPAFWSVAIEGQPGVDDLGLTRSGALVVSRRVLDALVARRVGQAAFRVYSRAAERRCRG